MENNQDLNFNKKQKSALEESLRSLTPAEREYGIMHNLTFRTPEEIESLKAKYKIAYTFSFGDRLKAACNILFSNKITEKLSSRVIHELGNEQIDSSLECPQDFSGIQNVVGGTPVDLRPLNWATTEPTTLSDRLKEAGIELTPAQKNHIDKLSAPILPIEDKAESTRMANDLDKKINDLFSPTIIETTTMTTGVPVKPVKKRVRASKPKPKTT